MCGGLRVYDLVYGCCSWERNIPNSQCCGFFLPPLLLFLPLATSPSFWFCFGECCLWGETLCCWKRELLRPVTGFGVIALVSVWKSAVLEWPRSLFPDLRDTRACISFVQVMLCRKGSVRARLMLLTARCSAQPAQSCASSQGQQLAACGRTHCMTGAIEEMTAPRQPGPARTCPCRCPAAVWSMQCWSQQGSAFREVKCKVQQRKC